jgi:hypothetical protein
MCSPKLSVSIETSLGFHFLSVLRDPRAADPRTGKTGCVALRNQLVPDAAVVLAGVVARSGSENLLDVLARLVTAEAGMPLMSMVRATVAPRTASPAGRRPTARFLPELLAW